MANNEELISEYIDEAAFKAQTDFAVAEINKLISSFAGLKKAKSDLNNSKGYNDISQSIKNAEKEQQALLKTQQQIIRVKQDQVKLENQLLQQQILQEKQAQANLRTTQAQGKVKKEIVTESITRPGFNSEDLKKTGTVVSEFDKQQAEAAISATEFGNSLNKQARVIKDEVTPAVKQSTLTTKQLALAQAEGKLLAQQQSAALKNQVREEIAVKGSLEQRRAALIRLNAVYDNQSPIERSSAAGQRLQKILGGLDTQVKTLESTTGRAQRNVGNYGSAFETVQKGASKAFSVLRNLAYLIPGIGIGGLIAAVADPIISLTKNLLGFGEVSEKVKQQQAGIASAFKSAADGVADEISKVTLLKAVLESDNATRLQKVEALKQLKAANVDYFGQLDIEDGKVKGLTTVYDAYITRLIRSINAKANVNLLTDALKEQANVVGTINKDLSVVQGKFTANNLTQFQIFDAIRKFNLTFGGEKGQSTFIGLDQLQLIADLLNAEAKVKSITDKIKTDVSDIFDPNAEKNKNTAIQQSLKSISDRLSQNFERFKLEQNNLLELLKEGSDDENSVYKDRLKYLVLFNVERKVLINEQLKYDLSKIEEKRSNDEKNLKSELKKKGADITGINREIATINFNASESAKTAKLKADIDLQNSDKENFKARKNLLEDFEKTKREMLDQEMDYEQWTADQIKKIRAGQAAGMKKFEDDDANKLEKMKAKMLSFLDTLQGYYNQVSGIISGALNIGATRKKNEAQDAIDAIDKQKDADLKANDARVQSEQDKAANIAIINSRAEQQKEQQRLRQRKIDQQAAQTEKALSIFTITLGIAKAVAKDLTKPYLIALDLALGAAQLAIVMATPIPRFKHGKRSNYSGPAIVGDGGRQEVIERTSGEIEITPATDTLTHLRSGDIVHPDKNAWMNAMLNAAHRDAGGSMGAAKGDNSLAKALTQQTRLLQQIANKKELHLGATDRGMVALWKHGSNTVKYFDENTNWNT